MKKRIHTDPEALSKRLRGERPTIRIAGQTYTFYIKHNELHPADQSKSIISLELSEPHAKSIRFLFNPKTGEIPPGIDGDSLDFPKELLVIELPPPVALDPVGFAWEHGIRIKDILKLYPCKAKCVAKIIPWQKTRFTRLIEENNWQKEREMKRGQPEIAGKKNTKRKGPRL